jgi:integrase/recombinase XerD
MGKVSGKGQAQVLSNEQIDSIIALCGRPYNLAVAIAAYTGSRMGEVIALRAENLDLGGGYLNLTETKNGEARSVMLHPELVAILEAAELPASGWLFPSKRTAGHISRQSVDLEIRAVCADLGIKGVGTHSFRRSLATNLHSKAVPLKTIASITGHKSLDQLSRYLDVSPEMHKDAIMAR